MTAGARGGTSPSDRCSDVTVRAAFARDRTRALFDCDSHPVKSVSMIVTVPKSPKRVLPGLLVVLAFGFAGGCSQAISPTFLRDAQTAVRVKTALVNDPVLGVRPIEVTVVNGVARLSGSVASEVERQHAVELARSVDGVRDVRTELVVRVTTAGDEPAAAGTEPDGALYPDVLEADELKEGEPGLLAVGISLRHSRPAGGDLESAVQLGPLFRLGAGQGVGVSLGFGWFGADLSSGSSLAGRVRIRPVMAGLAYTLGDNRLSASLSLVGGVAFNSLSQQHRSEGPVRALDVRDSVAWRPSVSLWLDLGRRTAFNLSAGYLMTRLRFSLLEDGRVQTRTLRGDTTMLSTGVVYKLF